MIKKGKIKISSENMMPIIKKWLYSDKDIFLREIVANAVDAITKHKKLVDMGEATQVEDSYRVNIFVDEKAKTLTVEDNGIGMTAEEVEKYITQIAFSGANDFLQKYENASGDGIIGHFGLGFYSAYMVSNNVEIVTKSYKNEPAIKWESDGNSTYKLSEIEKEGRGTQIIMHIADGEFHYAMSILKSNNGNPKSNNRYTYTYENPIAGEGRFIHTYMHDGNPLPSFEGEPKWISIPDDMNAFTDALWNSLNEENKVSLFVRYIDIQTGTYETKIINKNQ